MTASSNISPASFLSEAGLKQMQREPTRGQNLLDLFCCNKPSLVKSITSIPGISDHNIVLADCKLKPSINNNNNIYLKSSIQTSSIDYKNYYGMYKYNKYDYTNRSVIIING